MLILLRILFGGALFYEMVQGSKSTLGTGQTGDLSGAYYMAVWVCLAILNALVWAPYLGTKISAPLTGTITESTYIERINWVLRLIRWCNARKLRRLTLFLCFWEGMRHPDAPTAFVVGMQNARQGSWFEKIFAREVFRFHNTQNCVQAYLALRRHGIDPRPHPSQEISVVLLSMDRQPRPKAEPVVVPTAPTPAPLKRNLRIRMFKQDGTEPAEEPRT